jgi:hypothetical protein
MQSHFLSHACGWQSRRRCEPLHRRRRNPEQLAHAFLPLALLPLALLPLALLPLALWFFAFLVCFKCFFDPRFFFGQLLSVELLVEEDDTAYLLVRFSERFVSKTSSRDFDTKLLL